jgi:septum formation protein
VKSERNANVPCARLILASVSPRRAALMREYGYTFEVVEPPMHEPDHLTGETTPAQQAEALSYFKARSVATLIEEGTILAGDTVVALEDRMFGKPLDRDDARTILSNLSGTTHRVITAVTLLDATTGRRLIRHDATAVTIKPMSDPQLEAYLDTGAWAGKAGAYGIQDRGDAFIESIDGSFTNVVGLPMELLSRMLTDWGIQSAKVPAQPTPE